MAVPPVKSLSLTGGQSVTITCNVPVTWSQATGGVGTVAHNGDGSITYTAPAANSIPVQQQLAGAHLLPSDHIYNTNISNLPVDTNSAAYISEINTFFASYQMTPALDYGHNIIDNTAQTTSQITLFTPDNNGSYALISPSAASGYPGVPGEFIEGGILNQGTGIDRHVHTINPTGGMCSEIYNPHPVGTDSRLATSNVVSGVQYGTMQYYLGGGVSDAGVTSSGCLQMPLLIRQDEFSLPAINHASLFTVAQTFIQKGTIRWPATVADAGGAGTVYGYGPWFRLKSTFNMAGYNAQQVQLLKAWQNYGIIMTDGGNPPATSLNIDCEQNPTLAASMYAMGVGHALSVALTNPDNWDVVDPSALMIDPSSGMVNPLNTLVTPVGMTGIVGTDPNNSANHIFPPCALQGIAVGMPNNDAAVIQSGTTRTFNGWVTGTANQGITWTAQMGTFNGNVYTPPSVSAPTAEVITATSVANPSASTNRPFLIVAAGPIAFRLAPAGTAPYTDPVTGVTFQTAGTFAFGMRATVFQSSWTNPATQWAANPPVNLPLWYYSQTPTSGTGDAEYVFWVPNGNYNLTIYMGVGAGGSQGLTLGAQLATNSWQLGLDIQGVAVAALIDISVAGFQQFVGATPYQQTFSATVTNNLLRIGTRAAQSPQPPSSTGPPAPPPLLNAFLIQAA